MVVNLANTRLEELSDAALLALLKERSIYLSPVGDRLKISAPPGALDEFLRTELSRRKSALLAILSHCATFVGESPLERVDLGGPIPLTAGQERLWIANRLAPDTSVYSMPEAFLVEAPVSLDALRQAARDLIRRHEVLRTYFRERDGEPLQLLSEQADLPIDFTDLSTLAPSACDRAASNLIQMEARRPFDLQQPPLVRIHLIRLSDLRHLIFLNIHHIIADLPSLSIFRKELVALYASAVNGGPAQLPPLTVQYRDYVIWERERLTETLVSNQVRYWKAKLEGSPQSPRLPFARPRPPVLSSRGATKPIAIPKASSDGLAGLGREEGASLFMTLMAAFAVLLHRYSGESDFCIGMPITGRNRMETEPLIGLFVNLLVLRCRPQGNLSFREFLNHARVNALEAYANSDVPFQKLVAELNPGRADGNLPLVQIVFALDPVSPEVDGHAISIDTQQNTAKFDLTLQLVEGCDGICGVWEYSTDVFDEAGIEMLSRSFLTLLDGIVQSPDRPIRKLSLGCQPALSVSRRSYPRNATIHEVFEKQAQCSPDAIALIAGENTLTYRELDRKANQLARFLVSQGVSKETPVGLCMERSVEAVIGMIAILKAGGAYVPLDPAYPSDRLRYLLEDANVSILLSGSAAGAKLRAERVRVFCLDEEWPRILRENDEPLGISGDAEDLAYVMYTSGSTGKSNGVLIPHRGVVRLVKNVNYACLDEREVFLQFAPLSFDASTFEIWAPLLNGARLVLLPARDSSFEALDCAIRRHGVTTLWLTAGLFHAIVDERIEILRPLRQLLSGGDVLSPKHVYRLREQAPECRLINGYGPTENTTFSCCYTVPHGGARPGSIPIGVPISNTDVYLLDGDLSPVPPGAPGEIYIGGDGLARGYSNNAALTQAKFVANPFSHEPGARLFRSGDLARYLPDGNLEFLGRTDSQVKINGFRIETGEIESALTECPGIAEAVVVVRESASGQKNLAAYVVSARTAGSQSGYLLLLRSHLLRSLPNFMQPATITVLEAMPLTENGKLDRNALPEPGHNFREGETARTAPPDEIEARLLAIWEEVLGISPIGLNDDFFNLGGHSILALRLFSKIEAEWGLRLPLSMLLKASTIELLAKALREDGVDAPWTSLVAIQTRGPRPPLYIVSGVGGNVVRFHDLARHLGKDQPVFALQPPGLDGRQPYLTRLEDLAAHHVREIKEKQPEGPYSLVGYSFGGAVVFEMARQLEEQGEKPALVVLLDSPEWRYSAKAQAAMDWPRRFAHIESRIKKLLFEPGRRNYLSNRLKRLALRLIYKFCGTCRLPIPQRLGDIVDVNTHAVSAYRPKHYPGRIILLRTTGNPGIKDDDGTLGWSMLAEGGVEVHEIPGNHEDLTTEPNVQFLARILTDCLAAASK